MMSGLLYVMKEPTLEDLSFLLEVSDSSLAYGLDVKVRRYAAAAQNARSVRGEGSSRANPESLSQRRG
jgi:hypothetical protein